MLTQLLHGVQALQVAGAEEAAVQRFVAIGRLRQQSSVRNEVLSTVVRSLNETTIGLATGLLLLFAAGLMRSGNFTVGDFALFISYSGGGMIDELVYWVGRLFAPISVVKSRGIGSLPCCQPRIETDWWIRSRRICMAHCRCSNHWSKAQPTI